MFKPLLLRLLRHLAGGEAAPVAPMPYAPGHPDTCPGCASAVHEINDGAAPAMFCGDCGTWWAHRRHCYFYPANPASSSLTKH